MYFFVRIRTSGFSKKPELNISYSSCFFSILAKSWISFKINPMDPKFYVDHEYLVYFVDSSMVEALSLTSGLLPENLYKTASELCSL